MADSATLDEAQRERASVVGRLIFQANHEALERLTQRLTGEVQRALTDSSGSEALPATVGVFLDTLEKSPDLRDADKLVFRDLVDDLAEDLRARKQMGAVKQWLARLDEDARALGEIRSLYEKELDQLFGQLDTRGMPVHREKWESYVGFLKGHYDRAAILKEYEEETGALDEGLRDPQGAGATAPEGELNRDRQPEAAADDGDGDLR